MATYSAQCSAVGSFSYASYFKLYVVLTETDVSIENNTSKIQYNVYCQSSGSGSISAKHLKYFNLNGSDIINTTESVNASSPNAYIAIASGTTDAIIHNDDGSKSVSFSAKIQASSYGVSASLSGTFTLTTIARASSISCSTANIGSNPTVTITSASSSFRHHVTATLGSETVVVLTDTPGGTYNTWTIPVSFYKQIPNATSGTATMKCETYSGTTLIGTKSISFKVTTSESECRPTVSATIKDTNSTTTALTGDSSKLVKYKSTAQLVITSTVKNSASIKSVTVNGTNVGTSSSITLNYSNVSTATFTIVTTDSRGYTNTSYVVTPSYVNYVPLTVNANLFRPQPTTGEVQLTYSGNYFNGSFGSVSNALSITWKYKASADSEWTTGGTITPTISSNKISSATISLGTSFDYLTAYDFQLIAVDKLTTVTTNATVSVGMPVFYWGKDFLKVTGDFNPQNSFVHTANASSGTSGYFKWAEIVISSTYANQPIEFKICRRASTRLATITLRFQSTNGTDPSLSSFIIEGENIPTYIYKASTSTWYLYTTKAEAYDNMSIANFTKGSYMKNVKVTFTNAFVASLPSDCTQATYFSRAEFKSLYDNSSGTTGTISNLAESSANFSYLDIFYCDNNNKQHQSIRIYSPNGKNITLTNNEPSDSASQINIRTSSYNISGTNITYSHAAFASLVSGSTVNANQTAYNKIYKVIGYR